MKKIVVSGGFDPVHVGHLKLLEESRNLGDSLTVILNTNNFLKEKKGFIFMPFEERKKILLGFNCVDRVVKCLDTDQTVCKTLLSLKKKNQVDIFANGGDRKNKNVVISLTHKCKWCYFNRMINFLIILTLNIILVSNNKF